jgi:hypothetical protein
MDKPNQPSPPGFSYSQWLQSGSPVQINDQRSAISDHFVSEFAADHPQGPALIGDPLLAFVFVAVLKCR